MPPTDPVPIIVDTDPGVDDAIAILMLLADPTVDVVGITTTAGNVPLAHATRNTLALLEYAGRSDIPVYRGAARPINGRYRYARHVHSASGLTRPLPEPTTTVSATKAVPYLARTLLAAPGTLTVVALGPLTNLARLARQYPTALSAARSIVVMGGAVNTAGNATPHAEFNFYSDPTAARQVLEYGAELTLIDLAACRQVFVAKNEATAIRTNSHLGTLAAELLTSWFAVDDSRRRFHLYDPLAVLAVSRPEVMRLERTTMTVMDSSVPDDELMWGQCRLTNETEGPISIAAPDGVDNQAALAALRDLLDWR